MKGRERGLQFDGARGGIVNLRKRLVDWRQCSEQRQQQSGRRSLYDQPVTLPPHHRMLSRKFELAGNADGLVWAVSEQVHAMALSHLKRRTHPAREEDLSIPEHMKLVLPDSPERETQVRCRGDILPGDRESFVLYRAAISMDQESHRTQTESPLEGRYDVDP